MISYNGKVVTYNDKWIGYDPYNPLNLPPYTIRAKFAQGYTPTISDFPTWPRYRNADSLTLVNAEYNIWDITMNDTNWNDLFDAIPGFDISPFPLLEILGANSTGVTKMGDMFALCPLITSIPLFDTSNVTDMQEMFYDCNSLTTVPLFNTSKVTRMEWMFCNCTSLTTVPLFDTSNVTNMECMFFGCTNVESGALALYQQASTQSNPPTNHPHTFHYCGYNTPTGRAELAQIPSNWK